MKIFNPFCTIPLSVCLIILLSGLSGCNKLVEVSQPRNTLVPAAVFGDSSNVKAATLGLYSGIATTNTYNWITSVLNSLYADEITSISYTQFLDNALTSSDQYVGNIWTDSYASIYRANSLIEGVQAATVLSIAQKQQAIGEALFIRAFAHFTLLNIFGSIPLITTTDVSKTASAPQSPAGTVYQQIIADLQQAITYLPPSYTVSGNLRTRANKYVAIALLAKVYLYTGDWVDAETQASQLIGNSTFTIMTDLTKVFLNTSTEAILQWDGQSSSFTTIASSFVPTPGVTPSYIITPGLSAAFEPGDLRKTNWIGTSAGSLYPAKYKVATANTGIVESYTVMRLAELYLIRAEARTHENNVSGAQADLDVIRTRAGLGNTLAADTTALLTAIEQERRVELFCEWSNRFFDLKRTGRADAVLGPVKPGWNPIDINFPIPGVEIGSNPALIQNKGYN